MYIHINDRSNLDETIALGRDADGKYTIKRTLRDELNAAEERGFYLGRRDVVLVNGIDGQPDYMLEVADEDDPVGYRGDTWILKILDTQQRKELDAIARRMRQNAKDFAPANWLLR